MVVFNYSTRELTTKIVYYGPGLCGKTTNLQFIYDNMPQGVRGKMLSLATKSDRTLFFDFLPIDLGEIQGMKTKVQLYTVPGQVFYNETRRLVLKGADGIVFVADSQENMLEANLDSFKNLAENLSAHGMELASTPHVLQFNKQDLPNALPVDVLNERLNTYNVPFYEAVATTGVGVQETLKHITKLVLLHLNDRYASNRTQAASKPLQAPAPTPPPPIEVPSAKPVSAAPPPMADAPKMDPPGLDLPLPAASQPTLVDQPAIPLDPAPAGADSFAFDDSFVDEVETPAPAISPPPALESPTPAPMVASLPQPPTFEPSMPPAPEIPAMPDLPASPAIATATPVAAPPAVTHDAPIADPMSEGADILGTAPAVSVSTAVATPIEEDDVLDILPAPPDPPPAPAEPLPAPMAGATLKMDRADLSDLLAAEPVVTEIPAPSASASMTAVSAADPLFNEEGVEATRLLAGEPQEILIPLEVETPQGLKRLRLTLRLNLDSDG